jgi:hypothetical protein
MVPDKDRGHMDRGKEDKMVVKYPGQEGRKSIRSRSPRSSPRSGGDNTSADDDLSMRVRGG